MDQPLDVFGQQPGLNKLYTQLCLCFAQAGRRQEEAARTLEEGLRRLLDSVPWLAGQVIYDERAKCYSIRPTDEKPHLIIKNLTGVMLPSGADFTAEKYPAELLDENLVAPCQTIRTHPEQPAPVFLVQANFFRDDLLLVICGRHSCMDMSGQCYITSLLAKCCSSQDLTKAEIDAANARERDMIPLLDTQELEAETARQAKQAPLVSLGSQHRPLSSKAVWKYYPISGRRLAELKSEAMHSVTSDFVSTDDCLTALIWQLITRARSENFPSTDMYTTLTRTVDARSAAGIPATYTGNAVVKTASQMTVKELLDARLGIVATRLREQLSAKDVRGRLRFEATILSQGKAPNKPVIKPSTDVNLSSWAKERAYELDFGARLGNPEVVLRPTFEAQEGLVYLMPKRTDGEIVVAVCLQELDQLKLCQYLAAMKHASQVSQP